jgi:hypothetical protein
VLPTNGRPSAARHQIENAIADPPAPGDAGPAPPRHAAHGVAAPKRHSACGFAKPPSHTASTHPDTPRPGYPPLRPPPWTGEGALSIRGRDAPFGAATKLRRPMRPSQRGVSRMWRSAPAHAGDRPSSPVVLVAVPTTRLPTTTCRSREGAHEGVDVAEPPRREEPHRGRRDRAVERSTKMTKPGLVPPPPR